MRIEEKNGFFSISMLQEEESKVVSNGKNVSVYTGKMDGPENALEKKRKDAIAEAVKVIQKQFAKDQETDMAQAERRENIKGAKEKADAANTQLNLLREERASLKEEYGITDDSEEEKELNIVRKAEKEGVWSLTDEENETLAAMGEEGYSDYQYRALALDAVESMFQSEVDEAHDVVAKESAGIRATRQALLETPWKYTMLGASIQEKEMRKGVVKEMLGAATAEIKKHLDEELEKLVEEAKKREEERQNQEEKLEEFQKKKKEMEALVEKAQNGELSLPPLQGVSKIEPDKRVEEAQEKMPDQTDIQREIRKIAVEGDLLEEDLKGVIIQHFI